MKRSDASIKYTILLVGLLLSNGLFAGETSSGSITSFASRQAKNLAERSYRALIGNDDSWLKSAKKYAQETFTAKTAKETAVSAWTTIKSLSQYNSAEKLANHIKELGTNGATHPKTIYTLYMTATSGAGLYFLSNPFSSAFISRSTIFQMIADSAVLAFNSSIEYDKRMIKKSCPTYVSKEGLIRKAFSHNPKTITALFTATRFTTKLFISNAAINYALTYKTINILYNMAKEIRQAKNECVKNETQQPTTRLPSPPTTPPVVANPTS